MASKSVKAKLRVRPTQKKLLSKSLEPVSPGELLLEEFMIPMGLTSYRLAKECEVPAQRIGEILKGRRSITADTDLRLCRFFGLSNGYWLRAQIAYDIEIINNLYKRRKITKDIFSVNSIQFKDAHFKANTPKHIDEIADSVLLSLLTNCN